MESKKQIMWRIRWFTDHVGETYATRFGRVFEESSPAGVPYRYPRKVVARLHAIRVPWEHMGIEADYLPEGTPPRTKLHPQVVVDVVLLVDYNQETMKALKQRITDKLYAEFGSKWMPPKVIKIHFTKER
ncbi:MAG: hypothetical protein ACFFG0_17520 [Candidatus Thorarchaeota archaeon]